MARPGVVRWWVVTVVLTSCSIERGDIDAALDADAAAHGGADTGEVAEAGDVPITEPCLQVTAWGEIEATPGTLFTEGIVGQPLPFSNYTASLTVDVDRVQAETVDGRVVACKTTAGRQHACMDDAGLRSVSVFVGETEYAKPVPYHKGVCLPLVHGDLEPKIRMPVAVEAAPCVASDTVVIEGTLRNFDADLPVLVWLVGEDRPVIAVGPALFMPYRPCDVADGHYRCTTLGYDRSVKHKVFVRQGTTPVATQVSREQVLEVSDCQAVPAQLDIEPFRLSASP